MAEAQDPIPALAGRMRASLPAMEKPARLHLLELPLDILKAILKELPLTNDLTALALTNSTLHGLVIPMIYSRFDIVWPGALGQVEPRTGVDALTYGLSTLVMREELFHLFSLDRTDASHGKGEGYEWKDYGTATRVTQAKPPRTAKLRRGNYFSQFVKKFSLGNGPFDLVNEYLVTKEGGKMLGTLVALSILGMPNLQTFIWDMPTGILRDVWISLSSLGDHRPSSLEKVHIRFHNNKEAIMDSGTVRSRSSINQSSNTATAASPSAGPQTTSSPNATTDPLAPKFVISNHHVESPSFSVLPPLTSIIAIAMDELDNLDELSVLVGKSADKLRDLRVGIAPELHSSGFVEDSKAMRFFQARGGQSTLRLLFSELGLDEVATPAANDATTCLSKETGTEKVAQDPTPFSMASNLTKIVSLDSATPDITSIDPALTPGKTTSTETDLADTIEEHLTSSTETEVLGNRNSRPPAFALTSDQAREAASAHHDHQPSPASQTRPKQSLKLEILQLERHVLDPLLLRRAIDWCTLTSLTLLRCGGTDRLWRAFREWFAPFTRSQSLILSIPTKSLDKKTGIVPKLRRMPTSPSSANQPTITYRLNLKRLHTDTVSTDLMVFLKDTLAPNSLEYLFLQDNPEYSSPVSTAQIHKGALRRHHSSLTKLLLDSSHGPKHGGRTHALSARKWTLNRDLLGYITTPHKFPRIRELSISLEYKDWHFFLQQLPHIPTLRSLHIPVIGEHVYGRDFSIRDVAMGVANVVNLRQECELAYLAIATKCFEIVEAPVRKKGRRRSKGGTGGEQNGGVGNGDYDDDSSSDDDVTPHPSDEDDDDDDDSDEEGGGQGNVAAAAAAQATNAMESSEVDELLENESPSSEDEEAAERPAKLVKMKMREILFYDDRVSIFKARHGKL